MLQINYIREHKAEALERLKKRNIDVDKLLNEIIEKDDLRKDTQSKLDNVLSQSNQIAKEIGQYFKNGEKEKALTVLEELAHTYKDDFKGIAQTPAKEQGK